MPDFRLFAATSRGAEESHAGCKKPADTAGIKKMKKTCFFISSLSLLDEPNLLSGLTVSNPSNKDTSSGEK